MHDRNHLLGLSLIGFPFTRFGEPGNATITGSSRPPQLSAQQRALPALLRRSASRVGSGRR
ncbi:MAG: hypothetical protein WCZ02_09025, partial [Lysobacterales bacterium]